MARSPKRASGSSLDGPCSTANHPPRYRFSKELRIRKRRDFLLAQSRGRNRHSRHFIVVTLDRPGLERARIGVTVSRKIGNAVARNHVKRRVREFFRLHGSKITPGREIVFIAKTGAEKLSYVEVAEELAGALGV